MECRTCDLVLEPDNSTLSSRRTKQCRQCFNKALKINRDANREHYRHVQKRWRDNNNEKWLWQLAKRRALKNNMPFNITPEDIVIPKYCPALGIELRRDDKIAATSPSLDRIVPYKGYVKGNVIVISLKANRIKSNATADEILAVSLWLSNLHT